jgi:4-hydroxybenzoate polyprenyltransferase
MTPAPHDSRRKTLPRIPGLKPVIKDYKPRPAPEGQTFAGESVWIRYVNFVKLPHTLFALPFALLGVLYASFETPVSVRHVGLVVLAFTAARFAAMGFNRIADRRFDALNPRTMGRELPRGALTVRQASVAVVLASAVFVLSAALLNPLCFALSPIALAWILAYSYSKRFTSWSHLWLGMSLAMAPAGGYLAVAGMWSDPWWTLPVLAIGVLTWVAGFDMFYALPDEDFDRRQGLKSAVVLLGPRRAILVGKLLHAVTIAALVGFGAGAQFGIAYYIGVAVAAGILVWEHQLVRPDDLSRLNAAFFTMNGVMSIVVFLGALVGRFL